MKTQTIRVAAYALLMQDDKLLLCRLSDRMGSDEGYWTLPGGGLDFGEDPADAMVREVFEETGLTVRPTHLIHIDSQHHEHETSEHHSIRIIYAAEIIGGSLTYELNGSTDYCDWHTHTEIQTLNLVSLAEIGMWLVFEPE